VKRPRIYGSETRFRSSLARYISTAEDLLDQAVGVRKRIDAEAAARHSDSFIRFVIEEEWAKQVRRWFQNARNGLEQFLQDQMQEALPTLPLGLPPDTGKPRHWIGLENGEPWLQNTVEEMRDLQSTIGVRRDVVKASPAPARFEELYASGLVAAKVIDDHAKDMMSPRTSRQLANAIGSAKELVEATLRAAIDRFEQPYGRTDDLPVLMRKWRKAVENIASPDLKGRDSLDKAQAALASLVTFLAEWRNAYGRGHGRPEYPPGLTARHARLASDAAETCVRFIVTTMDDLARLPP
jgi:abortive infection Abi-like protein